MTALTDHDLAQIHARGMSADAIERQLAMFRTSIPFLTLDRPCTVGDGILQLTQDECDRYIDIFDAARRAGRVTKFVPASGAASRMFQVLLSFLEALNAGDGSTSACTQLQRHANAEALTTFFDSLFSFAFIDDLSAAMARAGHTLAAAQEHHDYAAILNALLFAPGLDYSHLPKALLTFHRYPDHTRTPIDEHFAEARAYALDDHGVLRLHFTTSPEHEPFIRQRVERIAQLLPYRDLQARVTYSHQQASTDTIAVDLNNEPFRDDDGFCVFRPGGHGALLQNLAALDADVVFLKNIDNVVPEHLAEPTLRYKRALGGLLVETQQQMFGYLEALTARTCDDVHRHAALTFANERLGIAIPNDWAAQTDEQQTHYLISRLHRPLRVCGMVRNTGEPGGGPFWVAHDGACSLQIVESSQIDPHSDTQQALRRRSTHFNPVDLVCGLKDFRGEAFALPDFCDPATGFISPKSYQGRPLRALELPGLWNGAMAHWNTIFVEVPAETFAPVKTVLDLLRPEHQPPSPR